MDLTFDQDHLHRELGRYLVLDCDVERVNTVRAKMRIQRLARAGRDVVDARKQWLRQRLTRGRQRCRQAIPWNADTEIGLRTDTWNVRTTVAVCERTLTRNWLNQTSPQQRHQDQIYAIQPPIDSAITGAE